MTLLTTSFPTKIDPKSFKKNHFEHTAWAAQRVLIGIDEVGRGCLAGPVVTAAAILKPHKSHRLLKDSKLLTPQERQKVFVWLTQNATWSIGIINNHTIDQINIWQATRKGMKRAALQLLATNRLTVAGIVVDAMPLSLANTRYHDVPIHYFPFGESKSNSIAAASIIAKVTRDALMPLFDPLFAPYGFAKHKGYATAHHQQSVGLHGLSIIHRTSFSLSSIIDQKNDCIIYDQELQMSLIGEKAV